VAAATAGAVVGNGVAADGGGGGTAPVDGGGVAEDPLSITVAGGTGVVGESGG